VSSAAGNPGAGAPTLGGPDGGQPPGTADHSVSGPLGSRAAARFALASGVTAVTVRTADLGGDLYRATTPAHSAFVPRMDLDGDRLQLQLTRTAAGDDTSSVIVELNARVRWRISLVGGSASATLDTRSADLAGVDLVGGAARIEVWLPRPRGRTVIALSGGARELAVHAPGDVPVQVRLARGAGVVTVDGTAHAGIAPGTVFTPNGWAKAADRHDVDAQAGVGTLTVDRY
jgi:hypothetical protein